MAQLPLAIRRDIRDKFEAAESPVQQQLLTVKSTLGLPVTLEIHWSLLWPDLEANSTEKADFVPYIIAYASSLLDLLNAKLEDESTPWADEFLELLTKPQCLRISIQTYDSKEISVRWKDGTSLVLYIPSAPANASHPSSQLMLNQLDNLFAKPTASTDDVRQATRPQSSSSLDGIMTPMSSLTFNSSLPYSNLNATAKAQPLPSLETLPRPEQLFSRSKRYIISMRLDSNPYYQVSTHIPDRLVIQSSHEQSLRLIHDYFTKWTRPDVQTHDKVPLMRHNLCASAVGHSTYDTLIVEPFSQLSSRSSSLLNPALYQCFVEDVLGYETVYRGTIGGNGGLHWEFRRSGPFT